MSPSKKHQNANELLDKYESSKGMKIMHELRSLQNSHYIVIKNYEEFIRIINEVEKDIMIMAQNNYKKFILAMREISRRLHNYLASIHSLIEHTGNFRTFIKNPQLDMKYNKELEQLRKNKCVSFVKKFRNYIQHFTLPIMETHLQFRRKDTKSDYEKKFTIFLDRDKLLKWKNWNRSDKDFMNEFDKEIPLKKLFEDYQNINNNFYKWFYNEVIELHSAEIDEYKKLGK